MKSGFYILLGIFLTMCVGKVFAYYYLDPEYIWYLNHHRIEDIVVERPEGSYRCFVSLASYKGGISCIKIK